MFPGCDPARSVQLLALTLIAWTHAGWTLFLRLAVPRGWGANRLQTLELTVPARVSVIVAAYAEETVIARTVAALRAQDHPDFEVIVACDGSPDATAREAAGADLVLELPRGGKHAAQAAAVARASGEVLAFCDANTTWEPGALTALVAPFKDHDVGYTCGEVSFTRADGATNQEGAYWRLELMTRRLESSWWSVTAGNGAIYALRAALWPQLETDLGHDLAFPHQVVRAGFLALDVPGARASELMVPSLAGEGRRKRRMMARMWGIVLRDPARGGLLDPRGLPPRYLLALVSHRWLRYASPALHVVALLAGVRSVAAGRGGASGWLNRGALAAQLAVLAAAALPGLAPLRARPFLLCRYYVLMTASIALGGWDRLRAGAPEAGWSPPEGTR